MRAKITLLSRMVFGIDKDRIVRARGHAGFATDADGFVEIDYPISALKHGRGGTSGDAWRMCALIAPGDLVRAPRLRKLAYVNMLDVRASDRQRYVVLGLTCSGAGVTADAPSVIDNLCPLNRLGLKGIYREFSHQYFSVAVCQSVVCES